MDELPPMPNLELSVEQQLRVERIRRELPAADRKKLEEMTMQFVKMNLILQNNLSQVFSWANGAKNK